MWNLAIPWWELVIRSIVIYAAMIGILAERKLMFRAGETSVDAEIIPSWDLAARCS